jgi:hypothetical protein
VLEDVVGVEMVHYEEGGVGSRNDAEDLRLNKEEEGVVEVLAILEVRDGGGFGDIPPIMG